MSFPSHTNEIERLAGRLLLVGVRGTGPGDAAFERDLHICREVGVAGVILFDVDLPALLQLEHSGLPRAQARAQAVRNIESPGQLRALTAAVRAALGDDAIVAADQEGGAVMRLAPARGFDDAPAAADFAMLTPQQQSSAARRMAQQLAACGVNVNFAPCVDVAVNPDGPVIARLRRAYGADPQVVTHCAQIIIQEHLLAGVSPCLKHYPGHGSAAADTHHEPADITGAFQPEIELAPYRALLPAAAAQGVMVMAGHLIDRRIDDILPASLSPAHISGRLRGELGFGGVVVTDALEMVAIASRWSAPDAAVMAMRAGVDLALHGVNGSTDAGEHPAPAMRDAIARAVRDGDIAGGVERLRASVRRITDALARARETGVD